LKLSLKPRAYAGAGTRVLCDEAVREGLTLSELIAIKSIATPAYSVFGNARKGFESGNKSRSSLIQMLTNKNIIKPCFLKTASHVALIFPSGVQLAAKIPK
jgi:hypothetical protein